MQYGVGLKETAVTISNYKAENCTTLWKGQNSTLWQISCRYLQAHKLENGSRRIFVIWRRANGILKHLSTALPSGCWYAVQVVAPVTTIVSILPLEKHHQGNHKPASVIHLSGFRYSFLLMNCQTVAYSSYFMSVYSIAYVDAMLLLLQK